MADMSDVEKGLVAQIASVLFPGVAYTPGSYAASAPLGVSVKIVRGWPIENELTKALKAGEVNITVFPESGMTRVTTRYAPLWFVPKVTAASITLTATGAFGFTIGGTMAAGEVIGVSVGLYPPTAYAYRVQAGDTATVAAAALAAQISGATASAGTVTTLLPCTASLGVDQTALMEVARQTQGFRISCWCFSPADRDMVAKAVSLALVGMLDANGNPTQFFVLPTGETAWVTPRTRYRVDATQKAGLWREDICVMVEYGTTISQQQSEMIVGAVEMKLAGFSLPSHIIAGTPRPTLGAIRWDAWYAPADALTLAVEAALAPSQFNYRAPFFATIAGAVSLPALTQQIMDAEIAAAVTARLDYWAFLAWPPGAAPNVALTTYLSSTRRGSIGFCMIEQLQNIYYGGVYQPELAATLGMVTQAGYQTVLGGRPLMYFLACDEPTITTRFGSRATLATVMALIRAQITASTGKNPYLVVMDPVPGRATGLVPLGFDAASAYSVPGSIAVATPYATLATNTEAWWAQAALQGVDVVPPVMAGWNLVPRITTPNVLFGAEVSLSAAAYYADGTPNQIATHATDALTWVAANRAAAPAQTALLYAWNEFDEGGWLCPTWVSGQPAGDASRVTALGAAIALQAYRGRMLTPDGRFGDAADGSHALLS